jgi:hypothetical protein
MTDMVEILKARGATHGDFADHARCTQELKRVFNRNLKSPLTNSQLEAVDMILHKLGRIASGNPNHADHWTDIVGYALLVEKQLL